MGSTIAEKILANKSGKDKCRSGEYVLAEVDIALANDITAPVAINEFEKHGGEKLKSPGKVVIVADHFTPNKDIKTAEWMVKIRDFVKKHSISKFYEAGNGGIEHIILPDYGLVRPGDLVVGGDSHTCTYGAIGAFATGMGSTDIAGVYLSGKAWFKVPETIKVEFTGKLNKYSSGKDVILNLIKELGVNGANYKAFEFYGEGIKKLSMPDRFTISNMVIEGGAKTGFFPVDDICKKYLNGKAGNFTSYEADKVAVYEKAIKINLNEIEPIVAYPFLPENGKSAKEAEKENIKIEQVVIGSCTNGRYEDLFKASEILKGKKIHSDIRCLVIPGSQDVYMNALKNGLIETFIKSGCVVTAPTCGPCLGGHTGVLGPNEKAVSTTNRNFAGRMGHISSEVYLANPEVAAASAIKGIIADPENI